MPGWNVSGLIEATVHSLLPGPVATNGSLTTTVASGGVVYWTRRSISSKSLTATSPVFSTSTVMFVPPPESEALVEVIEAFSRSRFSCESQASLRAMAWSALAFSKVVVRKTTIASIRVKTRPPAMMVLNFYPTAPWRP